MVWQPHYGPVRQLAAGLVRSKRAKRRLVVKAARQLAIDLWRLATDQTTAEKLGLIMHSDRGASKAASSKWDFRNRFEMAFFWQQRRASDTGLGSKPEK